MTKECKWCKGVSAESHERRVCPHCGRRLNLIHDNHQIKD